MYRLKFNGNFELEDPDGFLQEMQELIRKYKVEYFGTIHTQNLGQYVDFQKIEESVEEKQNE